jgi:EmrB/QacA subfamily drug resistance transporter
MDVTRPERTNRGLSLALKWRILISISLGMLVTTIDGSASSIALPFIGRAFGVPLSVVTWVNLAYLLAITGLLLSLGRLSDLVGRRSMYLAGCGLFTLMALLCGFAGSLSLLITLRVVQAIGAAMMFTTSMPILTEHFPDHQRGQALGLAAAAISAGVALGPAVGGLVLGAFSWPAIFWMNVPLGLLATIGAAVTLQPKDRPLRREPMDLPGAALSLISMTAVVLALKIGPEAGRAAWMPLAALGIAAGAAFLARERSTPHPLLDLGLFRDGTFRAATLAGLLGYLALYIYILLLPFFLIEYAAVPPTIAGLVLTAEPTLSLVSGPLGGRLSDRFGSRALVVTGLGITGIALWSLSRLSLTSSLWDVVWRVALVGLGIGLFYSPNSSALLGASPPSGLGVAAGVSSVARNLGMVSGLTVGSAVMIGYQHSASVANGTFLSGYSLALRLAAATCLAALLIAFAWMRRPPPAPQDSRLAAG